MLRKEKVKMSFYSLLIRAVSGSPPSERAKGIYHHLTCDFSRFKLMNWVNVSKLLTGTAKQWLETCRTTKVTVTLCYRFAISLPVGVEALEMGSRSESVAIFKATLGPQETSKPVCLPVIEKLQPAVVCMHISYLHSESSRNLALSNLVAN